jgi:hypothetical protein
MNYLRKQARLVCLAVLVLATVVAVVKLSRASIGVISKADLAGSWQAAVVGSSGCGTGSMLVTFTLNSSGTGTATIAGHSSGCGNSTTSGLPISITALNSNGSGTLGLSCGTACGWTFHIQVSPSRSSFNMADVTDPIPNFWAGTAVHQ